MFRTIVVDGMTWIVKVVRDGDMFKAVSLEVPAIEAWGISVEDAINSVKLQFAGYR